DVDVDDIEVRGEIEAFDGDTATVQISYDDPDGAELDGLFFGDTEVDVIYEDGRWVGEDCDFGEDGGSGTSDADVDAELAALGLDGTRDDPIPFGTAAPVGAGFELVVEAWDPDAIARFEAANDTTLIQDEGDRFAVLEYSVAYRDDEEPQSLSDLQLELVGSDSIAVDGTSCDALGPELGFTSRSIFMGGVFSGLACFSGTEAQLDGAALSATGEFFQERLVFFEIDGAGTPDVLTGSTGPSPDGDATAARTAPASLGTVIELDSDWTVQVNGFDADVTAEVLENDTFADDPGPDRAYALLDVTLNYTGSESGSPFFVDVALVGDSNVGADDCDFVTVRDELDRGAELFDGGTVSGNICFLVDRADTDSLVAWFQVGGSFGDPEFASIR
ncbi:MAG: hypothetical protein AAGG08_13445, partial [Actinomycetota bacterium]